jgi:hypothetical protein
VRLCDACREQVHYCDSVETARDQARQGHCVAVTLGVARREGDLNPPPEPRMLLGLIRPDYWDRERRRPESPE